MEIQGKLIEKYETIKINDSFRKREFVVEYIENPQYPELLKFDLIQDKKRCTTTSWCCKI